MQRVFVKLITNLVDNYLLGDAAGRPVVIRVALNIANERSESERQT